jgi:hypothetical protein
VFAPDAAIEELRLENEPTLATHCRTGRRNRAPDYPKNTRLFCNNRTFWVEKSGPRFVTEKSVVFPDKKNRASESKKKIGLPRGKKNRASEKEKKSGLREEQKTGWVQKRKKKSSTRFKNKSSM